MLLIRFTARRAAPIAPTDVGRVSGRVWPTEIDEFRHMNNGVYLSLLDHARLDLLERSGLWAKIRGAGVYPVVSMQTVSYRKSLTLGQKYVIESRMVGFDERSVYLEQRFVVDGEIYVRAFIAGRFLRDAGGVVMMAELAEITGIDVSTLPVSDWLRAWADGAKLPSTRDSAPSVWAP
jgi:acyl-CoA thioesterase FadM